MKKSILIIEDDIAFAGMLASFLTRHNFSVQTAITYKNGLAQLSESIIDMVISDYRLPDGNGLELLKLLRNRGITIPFIIMTGFHDIRTAVRSMQNGAFDYITKPVNPDELLMVIADALQPKEHIHQPVNTIKQVRGESAGAKLLHEYIELVAPTNMSVIIQGESGTGKEYVAKTIHALSSRSSKPFVAIDCGALSNELAASELFGHSKGAFTGAMHAKKGQFEYANGGTLFLDEIGNLSYETQVKLLRALQEKTIQPVGSLDSIKIDVRIIVATNNDLQSSVKAGTFREDLYHRLNEFSISTPSLRERFGDLDLFIAHFIHQANIELNKEVTGLSIEVLTIFKTYDWPGNLRELKNVIKRSVLLSKTTTIETNVLPIEMKDIFSAPGSTLSTSNTDLKAIQELTERKLIEKTLIETKYNKTKAAQLLNIDRKTLYNKMEKYNL